MERYQRKLQGLGSTIFLTLITAKDEPYATGLLDRFAADITAFEQQFSRFREDSELTAFNRKAGERVTVTESFRRLLTTAQTYAQRTDGTYNPFVLPALQRAGYKSSWPNPQAATTVDFSAGTIAPISALQIGPDWARIPPHTALDFGGIGKGYLLDELATALKQAQLAGYWLSLGGDIICAGHDVSGDPWQIGVQDAQDATQSIYTLTFPSVTTAVATSGITKRQGTTDGHRWHHLIDPRTGQPANTDILTATVAAASATAADIYAKTIIIEGETTARRYRQQGHIQSYVLQRAHKAPIIEP